MPRSDEYDWVFDFVLQFLESDKFDASVMNFLDEKCDVFDDEEENKFIYSTIHREFCEHIETLISSNLGELGITNEMFLDACEKGRSGRDINTTVFERLIAMDDFQTFKKIMTKRNTELQLESLRSFKPNRSTVTKKESSENSKENDELEEMMKQLLDPEELALMKENSIAFDALEDEDMQDLLFQSLMEMELIHRHEELEYAELERAMIMSLIIEEERLKVLTEGNDDLDSSFTGNDDEEDYERNKRLSPPRKLLNEFRNADSKESSSSASTSDSKDGNASDAKNSSVAAPQSKAQSSADILDSKPVTPKRSAAPSSSSSNAASSDSASDPKPLKGLRNDMKPLPSIGQLGSKALPPIGSSTASKLVNDFDEKKRVTEEALKLGSQQLSNQRVKEEELRKNLTQIDPEEAERRAKHMKEQRDLLVAKKKQERERVVQAEAERKAKINADGSNAAALSESIQRINAASSAQDAKGGESKSSAEELADLRRSTMRNALARRMKLDLIESEENKKSAQQDEQYSELDVQLQQVEQLREDNRKREYIMNKHVERQQAQIARNVRMSAAAMSRVDDEY